MGFDNDKRPIEPLHSCMCCTKSPPAGLRLHTEALFKPQAYLTLLSRYFIGAEIVAADRRAQALIIIVLGWVFGSVLLSPIAYVLTSWWQVELWICAPGVLLAVLNFW